MPRSYRDAFPSKYLKADDVSTSPVGTIASVDFEEVGVNKERRLIVRFVEPTLKALILNLINSDSIAEIVGSDDYTKWPGQRIRLVAAMTFYQGRRVPCLRVTAPQADASTDITANQIPF